MFRSAPEQRPPARPRLPSAPRRPATVRLATIRPAKRSRNPPQRRPGPGACPATSVGPPTCRHRTGWRRRSAEADACGASEPPVDAPSARAAAVRQRCRSAAPAGASRCSAAAGGTGAGLRLRQPEPSCSFFRNAQIGCEPRARNRTRLRRNRRPPGGPRASTGEVAGRHASRRWRVRSTRPRRACRESQLQEPRSAEHDRSANCDKEIRRKGQERLKFGRIQPISSEPASSPAPCGLDCPSMSVLRLLSPAGTRSRATPPVR